MSSARQGPSTKSLPRHQESGLLTCKYEPGRRHRGTPELRLFPQLCGFCHVHRVVGSMCEEDGRRKRTHWPAGAGWREGENPQPLTLSFPSLSWHHTRQLRILCAVTPNASKGCKVALAVFARWVTRRLSSSCCQCTLFLGRTLANLTTSFRVWLNLLPKP